MNWSAVAVASMPASSAARNQTSRWRMSHRYDALIGWASNYWTSNVLNVHAKMVQWTDNRCVDFTTFCRVVRFLFISIVPGQESGHMTHISRVFFSMSIFSSNTFKPGVNSSLPTDVYMHTFCSLMRAIRLQWYCVVISKLFEFYTYLVPFGCCC